jgi:hypothetical protein
LLTKTLQYIDANVSITDLLTPDEHAVWQARNELVLAAVKKNAMQASPLSGAARLYAVAPILSDTLPTALALASTPIASAFTIGEAQSSPDTLPRPRLRFDKFDLRLDDVQVVVHWTKHGQPEPIFQSHSGYYAKLFGYMMAFKQEKGRWPQMGTFDE